MPLEATVMVIDNSEYMRNGDYQPTRFDAQSDAVNVIFQTKTDSNPENTVGIMTSGGKCPEVLVTHTKDLGQILQGVHAASKKIGGSVDIPTAINIAQLALKHRENKNQRQRILVFVGSPISEAPNADEQSMIKLARKLKKNNVAVDVVAFGDGIEEEGLGAGEDGRSVLKTFVENVNSGDNSHYLEVPEGSLLLSDAIITSPVLAADRGALIPEELQGGGGGGETAGGSAFEFGVDPSIDPELAMALRLSMQEAEARDRLNAPAESSSSAAAEASSSSAPSAPTPAVPVADTAMEADGDEEEELRRALAMSKADADVDMEDEDEDEDEDLDDDEDGEGEDDEDEDEDEAIQRAIQMSMEGAEKDEEKDKK